MPAFSAHSGRTIDGEVVLSALSAPLVWLIDGKRLANDLRQLVMRYEHRFRPILRRSAEFGNLTADAPDCPFH
jgi:hypothetical protein